MILAKRILNNIVIYALDRYNVIQFKDKRQLIACAKGQYSSNYKT